MTTLTECWGCSIPFAKGSRRFAWFEHYICLDCARYYGETDETGIKLHEISSNVPYFDENGELL